MCPGCTPVLVNALQTVCVLSFSLCLFILLRQIQIAKLVQKSTSAHCPSSWRSFFNSWKGILAYYKNVTCHANEKSFNIFLYIRGLGGGPEIDLKLFMIRH